jgi:hypothetical protein
VTRLCAAAGAVICLLAVQPPDVFAQSVPQEQGRFEVAAGPVWTGRESFGVSSATETSASGGRFTLFQTSSALLGVWGVEARVGVRVTRALEAEASSSYSRPTLRTSVSADVENGDALAVDDLVRQITLDGSIVLKLERWRFGRGVPFVSAGAGYVRQIHESNTLVSTGQSYHVGGGAKYLLMARDGRLKGVGIRGDVRALVRTKGVAFDNRAHLSPVVAASLFFRF